MEQYVFDVGGDVTLSGASRTAVYAARGTGDVSTLPHLFAKRTTFHIGGELKLLDTASLYPVADPLTGTVVFFDVAGAVAVAEGASADAKGRGYDWVLCENGVADERMVATINKLNTSTGELELHQTFARSPGYTYIIGAGHGGASMKASGIYGQAYGSRHAPLTCGSPSGLLNQNPTIIGGGVVWIDVSEQAVLHGTLSANSGAAANGAYAAPSGGSIWMTAGRLKIGSTARFSAKGGNSDYSAQGGGGRIALATALTAARVATLGETGELPGLSARRFLDQAAFEAKWPGVTGTVARGGGDRAGDGTFCFIDGVEPGLVIVVK